MDMNETATYTTRDDAAASTHERTIPMTDHLAAARAAIHAEHGWSMAAPASSLADMASAIAHILDHLEAQQTESVLCHECGGYDCDCASDPRCNANRADRYDSDGDRWGWCDPCGGFRLGWCHAHHYRGAGLDAASVDKCYGPLTFTRGAAS